MSNTTLEDVYEELAETLDRVGRDAEGLLLTKTVLLMAHALGDPDRALQLIREAEENLSD